MFNIGGGELIVIMLIALIVLGPNRLPDAARTIGKTMAELRRLSTSFQNEVRTALDSADDPNQVASRRNVLAAEELPPEPAPQARPPRTKPLVAGPAPDEEPPSQPTAEPATPAAAKPKNGTTVKKASPAKSPPRRAKPS